MVYIYFFQRGPKYITAQDIILPSSVEIIDNTQHITNLTKSINLCIELKIERNCEYRIKTLNIIGRMKYSNVTPIWNQSLFQVRRKMI